MDLQILMGYLEEGMQGDTLKLRSGEEIEYALTGLMQQTGNRSFLIEQADLRLSGEEITLEGLCGLTALAGGDKARVRFIFRIRAGRIWYCLSLMYESCYNLVSFFGGVHPVYCMEDGHVKSKPEPLSALELAAPIIHTDSDRMKENDPFTIESGITIRPEGIWKQYGSWLLGISVVKGCLSMKKAGFMGNHVDFWLEIPIVGGSFSNGLFSGAMMDGTLAILMDSHATAYDDVRRQKKKMTRVEVRCEISLKGINTPVMISAPLFGNRADWHFKTDFPDGLAVTDLAGFVMSLLGMSDSKEILLPEDSPLDNFRLQSLRFSFWGNTAVPKQIELSASTAKPWQLPLPSLTFQYLSVDWNLLKGSGMKEWSDSYAMTATVSGLLSVDLGKRSLELEATAYLPEMDIEAGLVWKEKEEKAALSDLFGTEAAEKLPEGQSKNLAEFYVFASAKNRSMELSGRVKDVLQWKIGFIDMKLTDVMAYAGYYQGSVSFTLQGIFLIGTGASAFSFVLEGGYNGESWFFKGYLGNGVVRVSTLLKGLLGIDYQEEESEFVLNQFMIAFDTKDNAFELQAGFKDTWNLPVGNLEIMSSGTLKIKNSDIMEQPYLAAKLSLMIDSFRLSAEVVDFFDEEKVSYIFQIWLADHGIQAVYSKHAGKDSGAVHEFLTVELLHVTLGDLVLLMIGTVNPNFHYTLPSPWNLLHKIDLSRFLMEYDITDGSITVSYRADLKIPGILEVHSVGLYYGAQEGEADKTLRLVVMGKTLFDAEEKDYGWDALNGQPPDVGSESDNRFRLHYLGAGQHFGTADMQKAETVDEAMRYMEDTFDQAAFDDSAGFILGVHFSLEDMLDFQLVFQDPVLYGISVTVSASKEPLAYLKGLSLMLMYKKITKDIGMFRARLVVPDSIRHIRLGIVNLTLGEIGLDLYTNGEFLLDLGFPAGRDFSRSFALEVGGYCGHGGLKFGKLGNETAVDIPKTNKGVFHPVITVGVGLSFGLGRSFDFGVVKGGVSLEVAGILEGVFAVFHPNSGGEDDLYYSVKAAVGIKGRLYLEADLKIIAISASVEIEAWAVLCLTAYEPVVISLSLELTLKARIKILFIRISFSFHFKAEVTFRLGEEDIPSPPWAMRTRRVRRCLVNEELFAPAAVLEEKARIPLHMEQLYSLDGGKWCVAFVPLIYKEEFRKLAGILAKWLIRSWTGEVTREEAMELSFEVTRNMVDYKTLCGLLGQNLVLELGKAKLRRGNMEEEAVVIPMPPAISLSCQKLAPKPQEEAEEPYEVNYWEYNMVTQEYADWVREYFNRLSPVKDEKENGQKQMESMVPLAEVVFTDYFHMLLRAVIGQIHTLYEQFEVDVCHLSEVEACCGLTLSETLSLNRELRMKAGEYLVWGCSFLLEEGETLHSLAVRCGRSFSEVLEELLEVPQIINQNVQLDVPAFEFNHQQFGWSLKLAAAFFFVRLYGVEMKGGYQKTAERILEDNGTTVPGMHWEEKEGGSLVVLPGIGNWYTVAGDTVVRLAEYCAVMELEKGELSRWDEFLNAVRESEDPGKLIIPGGRISLLGELTLGSLLRRLYPDPWNPEMVPVFRPMSSAVLTKKIIVTEGSSLAMVIQDNGITVGQAAECFIPGTDPLMENQKLKLEKVPYLRKDWMDRMLEQDAWMDDAGVMASRFMLQGLRLPVFNECHEVTGMSGFYKMLGQQILLEENYGIMLKVDPGQGPERTDADISWITGTLRKETSWDEILPQLPVKEYQWTDYVKKISRLPDKKMAVKTYGVISTMQWMRKAGAPSTICFVDEDMQAAIPYMEGICMMTGKEKSSSSAAAVSVIEFTVKRTAIAGYYSVAGIRAADRDRLKALSMVMKPQDGISYGLCHLPSPLQSKGILYQSEWDQAGSVLMRVNLSLETQAPAHAMHHDKTTDTACFGSVEFLQLLWECSIVGGSGYYLNLASDNGETLSEDSFDENGMGSLWILAQDRNGQKLMKSGCANAVSVSEDIAGTDRNSQGGVSFYASGALHDSLVYAQRQFPAGCIGIELDMAAPAEEAEDALSSTRRLFHVLGYDVRGKDFMEAGPDSTPLVPQEGAEGSWRYMAVLPLYRYVADGKRDFIYEALGKEGNTVFSCRDVLGNGLGGSRVSPNFIACYNDPVLGWKQWPGVLYEYDFCREGSRACLDISLRPGERDMLQYPKKAAERLRESVLQLSMEDVGIAANISMSGEFIWDREKKDRLVQFVEGMAGYLEGTASYPQEEHFLFDIVPVRHQEERCYPLLVSVTVSRSRYLPDEDEECVRSETKIAPAIAAEWRNGRSTGYHVSKTAGIQSTEIETDEKDSAVEFAKNFEAVFPGRKLARSSGMDHGDFYVVVTGAEGLIPPFEIRPGTCCVNETMFKTPSYWGIKPLSNRQLSRQCLVDGCLHGSWEKQPRQKVYAHVDLDSWGREFLNDFEILLNGEAGKRAAVSATDILQRWINVKKQLAQAIGRQLELIREGEMESGTSPSELVTDRARRSLSEAFELACIARYDLSWKSPAAERFRLCAEVIRSDKKRLAGGEETSSESWVHVKAGKIDSEAGSFCLLYHSDQAARSGFLMDFTISISELEWKIETDSRGYERSKWLTFLVPITHASSVMEADLSSDFLVPNPLRRIPGNPELKTQDASIKREPLYLWDYRLHWRAMLAEQDVFRFHVSFRKKPKSVKAQEKDLFDYLAQYQYVRKVLWDCLHGDDMEVFLKAAETFAGLAESIGQAWGIWTGLNRRALPALYEEDGTDTCTVSVQTEFEGGPHLLVSADWKDVTAKLDDGQNEALPGEYADMSLSIAGLNLYEYNLAVPISYVVRNENLMKLRNGGNVPVNPGFVYTSERMEMAELYAGQTLREEIYLFAAAGRDVRTAMQLAARKIFQCLGMEGVEGLSLGAVIRYCYEIHGNEIGLPVAMLLPKRFDQDTAGRLSDAFLTWYEKYTPEHQKFTLRFQFIIRPDGKDEILLGLENLRVDFEI